MSLYTEEPSGEFINFWADAIADYPRSQMASAANRYWFFLKKVPMPVIQKAFQLAGSKGRFPAPDEILAQLGEARATLPQNRFTEEVTLEQQLTDEMNQDQIKINGLRMGWLREMLATPPTMTKQEVDDAIEQTRDQFFWSGTPRYQELARQQVARSGQAVPQWMIE